eukprot:m.148329 g.148329  ORF g.148329 m.148329 type:complete len:257 (+) comp16131_c1_seq2:200-970(+)
MVSLNDTRYSAVFSSVNVQDESDPLIAAPSTAHVRGKEKAHRHISVVWSTSLGLGLMCALEAMLFVPRFRFHLHELDDNKAPFAFLCLLHVAVWTILLGLYRYGESCHRASRLQGYLYFYRDTQMLRRTPVVAFSCFNAILLCFSCFWSTNDEAKINRQNLMQIIVSLELAICLPCHIVYLVKVIRFNWSNDPPDVHSEFHANGHSTVHSEFEFDRRVDLEELLERQSDMLKYMRQYTVNLQSEVVFLQAQLRSKR